MAAKREDTPAHNPAKLFRTAVDAADHVIGYNRHDDVVAIFVEVHPASSNEVGSMEKKWRWLQDFLKADANHRLRRLPSEYHWVASANVRIPRHTHQYKRLKLLNAKGLQGPVKQLHIS